MGVPGHVWPELTKLHYIDANGDERAEEGTTTGGTGVAGHIWIEGDSIHYIDEYGDERYLPFEHVGTDPTEEGFLWIPTNWVHYSAETDADEKKWHSETAHTDHEEHTDLHDDVHLDDHTDYTPHNDIYDEVPHSDTSPHYDHTDLHDDYPTHSDHINTHTDTPGYSDHTDDHSNYNVHTDTGYSDYSDHFVHSEHTDTPHTDNPAKV